MTHRRAVPRSITFDDGTIVRGETDAELVRNAETHIRAAHPQLAGRLSREEILALAREDSREEETR
jgi:predicted small metal-binding protein